MSKPKSLEGGVSRRELLSTGTKIATLTGLGAVAYVEFAILTNMQNDIMALTHGRVENTVPNRECPVRLLLIAKYLKLFVKFFIIGIPTFDYYLSLLDKYLRAKTPQSFCG